MQQLIYVSLNILAEWSCQFLEYCLIELSVQVVDVEWGSSLRCGYNCFLTVQVVDVESGSSLRYGYNSLDLPVSNTSKILFMRGFNFQVCKLKHVSLHGTFKLFSEQETCRMEPILSLIFPPGTQLLLRLVVLLT